MKFDTKPPQQNTIPTAKGKFSLIPFTKRAMYLISTTFDSEQLNQIQQRFCQAQQKCMTEKWGGITRDTPGYASGIDPPKAQYALKFHNF